MIGNSIILILFLFINYQYYDSFLGLRFQVNGEQIFSLDISSKIDDMISILWKTPYRIGYFYYMPYLIILYIFYIIKNNKFDTFWKIKNYSILISFFIFLILIPNKSGVDFGSRYLLVLIIPSMITLNQYFFNSKNISRLLLILIIIFSIISFYFTNKYITKIILNNRDCIHLYNIIEKDYRKNTIWIFHNDYLPSLLGFTLFDNQFLVIRKEEDVESFVEKLRKYNLQEKYKKIVIFQTSFPFVENQKLDSIFYEDSQVKESLENELKKIYRVKEIKMIQEFSKVKLKLIYLNL